MAPIILRDALRQVPFLPFRIVRTDGQGYDIRHPDQVSLGMTWAVVGLLGDAAQEFPDRYVTVDLLHLVRMEPLHQLPSSPGNGQQS